MKKRKFIVKPFAPTAGLAPRAATDLWTTLKAALEKIFRHEMAALSFSELYRFAYRLMVDKQGDTVYSGVYESLSQHFQRKREEVAARPNGPAFLVSLNEVWLDSLKILHAIKDIFMYVDRTYVVQHNKKPIFARGLQVFFDAVVNSPAVRTRLRQLLQRQVLRERLGEVIDRSTMKSIMEMLVVLGPKKSVYKDFFETAFLENTREFYQDLASTRLNLTASDGALNITCPQYLDLVVTCLTAEGERVSHYLDPSTRRAVLSCVEQELIAAHADTLVNMEGSGAADMFRLGREEQLRKMYDVFARVNDPQQLRQLAQARKSAQNRGGGTSSAPSAYTSQFIFQLPLTILRDKIYHCIKTEGTENSSVPHKHINTRQTGEVDIDGGGSSSGNGGVKTSSSSSSSSTSRTNSNGHGGQSGSRSDAAEAFVQQLVMFNSKCERMLRVAFRNDAAFTKAYQKAMDSILNNGSRPLANLTEYIDRLLKDKTVVNEDLETHLGRVIALFRFLRQKDLFEHSYKVRLARRLVSARSPSMEIEKIVLSQLKVECGVQYTAQLEGMLNDMERSKKLVTQFLDSGHNSAGSFLVPQVLTMGFWPNSSKDTQVVMPRELQPSWEDFRRFYTSKHYNRILSWQPQMGNAIVRYTSPYKSKKYELVVTTFQMCVLLLFNELNDSDCEQLSFLDIQQRTKISSNDLEQNIVSLLTSRCKILSKVRQSSSSNGPGGDSGPSTQSGNSLRGRSFKLNSKFSSHLYRVRVPFLKKLAGTSRGDGSEDALSRAAVLQTRIHHIDSVVVRILKARRRIGHQALVLEVAKHLVSRFKVQPSAIKKRIESLMEREYLRRDPSDKSMYEYVA